MNFINKDDNIYKKQSINIKVIKNRQANTRKIR